MTVSFNRFPDTVWIWWDERAKRQVTEGKPQFTGARKYSLSDPAWHRETGWLVERGGNGTPMYRTLEQGVPVWTADSLKALRFARREDAELFAAEDEDAWLITEHSWEGPLPATQDGDGNG